MMRKRYDWKEESLGRSAASVGVMQQPLGEGGREMGLILGVGTMQIAMVYGVVVNGVVMYEVMAMYEVMVMD